MRSPLLSTQLHIRFIDENQEKKDYKRLKTPAKSPYASPEDWLRS